MTLKETIQILAILNAFYGQGKADPKMMANAWHVILKDFEYTIAEQAVYTFAKSDYRDYATFPSVGQIVKAIRHEEKMPNLIFNFARHGELYRNMPDRAKEMITEEAFERLQNNKDLMYDENGFSKFVQYLKLPSKMIEGR